MNNEPVAWMDYLEHSDVYDLNVSGRGIPLYTHPVKELHLSLQKDKETGELLAVTYTDDEHRIVEVLWQRPPVKELTDLELLKMIGEKFTRFGFEGDYVVEDSELVDFARAILKKAQNG